MSVFAGTPPQATGAVVSLEDADNAHLDDGRGQVYIGYGRALAEIDSVSNTVTARIPLAGDAVMEDRRFTANAGSPLGPLIATRATCNFYILDF